jgi:peptidoglycan/LPS O-acetylase OafA/YrhL
VLVVLVAGIAATWVLADGVASPWLFTGGLFAHSSCSALVICLVGHAPDALVSKVLAWRPLRWFGEVSYGLYLWHWPVFVLFAAGQGWARTAAASAVSVAAAALSKYLVEDPVRFRVTWARGRVGVLVLVAVMTGLALLWSLLPAPAPPAIDITRLG